MTDAELTPDPAGHQKPRFSLIGPGLVVAATGVGAGDLVAALVAGERYGHTLLWAAVVGCVIKLFLAEGVGRFTFASGRTLFDGWASLGRWASVYFGAYIIIWGLVYGAAGMTAAGLPLAALFPVLPLKAWAALCGVAGLIFVWFNRYAVFEKVMAGLTAVMFVTVVGLAILSAPSLPEVLRGLIPTAPAGSALYVLGLIGGVGGTITMAAYGYWLNAKGWHGPEQIPAMRLDNRVAYAATGVFVLAMLIVGAQLLYASGVALKGGDRGLLDLAEVLEARFGQPVAMMFLIGFFATAFTSVIGVWQGVSLLFADFFAHVMEQTAKKPGDGRAPVRGEGSPAFRGYMLWLTFAPMPLLFLDRPYALVLAYGVLGALFMPFLATTLLWLLNSNQTPRAWRNGWVSNAGLLAATVLFVALGLNEVVKSLG
ncbi:Nramp family divalent metal transporter [Brevundimonas sp. 2R-24]|uniref:Nramp family divalent metal transporter n=1 Tax=Peiella sedimenti TaxID=3061083 RepID=A0ABT8SIP2_9CAUL|nr:Nramp family divalent metal transporter [Caulobacteraceae bacterium XZ-24]